MLMSRGSRAPELLSPAGNYEKMVSALRFGADACYLAGKGFGMRSSAGNFTEEELSEAVGYAHSLGKKIYVTVNTLPHGDEYGALGKYIAYLYDISVDGIIVADLGVMALAKSIAPELPIHVSTQTSVVSARAAEEYLRLGAKRVVLARELTLEEIKKLSGDTSKELELESFVHGSMCVSWSGRCLLSNYFTGRDANRGQCTQPCRWNYRAVYIEEEKRPGEMIPLEENEYGTFVMSSKDMCMIEHVPELIDAGINSFKIEGRMKSAYYTAVTANVYRMAIDSFMSGSYSYNSEWLRELESVSHREYCTGFYFGRPEDGANTVTAPGYVRDKTYVGPVLKYEGGRVYVRQSNKISEGEAAEIITPGRTGRSIKVCDMRDEQGNPVDSAPHPGMVFSFPLAFEARPGDMIRK
ncbi:MAG: U32 family peptidase [Clostridia bacterium]|nr:U32 family peptidase [Clostridia bacterium]